MTYTATAIILHRRDIGEWDRWYTAYTREYGKLEFVGKGTRRPKAKLAAHCEPLCECDLVLARGRTMDRLTFARALRTNDVFSHDYDRYRTASFFVECVDTLTKPAHPDADVYDLLHDALAHLSPSSRGGAGGGGMHGEECSPPFLLRLLTLLGYAPVLDRCVECRTAIPESRPAIGVPWRGGVVCRECRGKHTDGILLTATDRSLLVDCCGVFAPQPTTPAVAVFASDLLAAHLPYALRTAASIEHLTVPTPLDTVPTS